MKKLISISLLLFLLPFINGWKTVSYAQNREIDSVLSLLLTDAADTNKVNHLNKLANSYRIAGLYDKSSRYSSDALQLAQQLDFQKGILVAYTGIGLVYWSEGNNSGALDYFLKSLKLAEKLNDKRRKILIIGNIGNVYFGEKSYAKAQEHYFTAVKLAEELKDTGKLAIELLNVGNTYWTQKDIPKALSSYFR